MKKVLSILIAMLLIASLTACGEDIQKPSDVLTDSTGDAQQSNTSSTPSNTIGESTPESTTNNSSQLFPTKVTINETVLVDESGVKITAKSLNAGLLGTEIKLLVENNSGQNLTVQCRNASVNGYMVDTIMSTDVVNGKKANDSLILMNSSLKLCNIDTIADIELSFHIFTSDNWETYLDTDQIQLKTSAAVSYKYEYDDSGHIAYNKDNIKIIIKGLSKNESILGSSIVVYIENLSNDDITVQVRDISINGFMISPIFSCDVLSNKHAVDTITFLSSDLEENGIKEISSVELSFHIFDSSTWNTIADSSVVTITF